MSRTSIREELALRLLEAQGDLLLTDLFGTSDTNAVADVLIDLVAGSVGENVVGIRLVRISSGLVVGLDLSGREPIVLKVHRRHLVPRLEAILLAQRTLAGAGIPVATPLLHAPVPVGSGAALSETWLAEGETVDVRPADRRCAIARCGLAISQALDPDDFAVLAPDWPGRFPPPHSPLFDFDATTSGAEWIDAFADYAISNAAKLRANSSVRRVVAHADLRPENVLLDVAGSEPFVSSVYDLDSLLVGDEPWLVGGVARAFSTNWSLADPMLPTVSEISAFIADYEAARGQPFTPDEQQLAQLGAMHALAYSARCEHALFPDGSSAPWGPGWRSLLRMFADRFGV